MQCDEPLFVCVCISCKEAIGLHVAHSVPIHVADSGHLVLEADQAVFLLERVSHSLPYYTYSNYPPLPPPLTMYTHIPPHTQE